MKRTYILFALLMCFANCMWAIDFTLKGNSTSRYLTLKDANGELVTPESATEGTTSPTYKFIGVEAGIYTVTGLASDNATVNGTAEITIDDETNGTTIQMATVTTGVSNSGWTMGTDWTVGTVEVVTNTQKKVNVTYGASTIANRISIVCPQGCSWAVNFIPSDERKAQNYAEAQSSGTVTSVSTSASTTCPHFGYYTVTLDEDVNLTLGWKTGAPTSANSGTHFVPLNNVEPEVTPLGDGKKKLTFRLNDKYYYIYNASLAGKRPLKGFFCYYADEDATHVNPNLAFDAESFGSKSPKWMNHDAFAHSGSNVADIFMNINEKGYLSMSVGEERDVFAQRNWQLINSIMNYYVEPDYHYTVINTNGEEDHSVVEFDNYSTTWNPWVSMKAVGQGTAIVLVTYDACKTKIHAANGNTSEFYFNDNDGEWSALWPENTGVFVVTVGQDESTVVTGMKNAEGMNVITSGANAGKATRTAAENVDAELDVFYFTEEDEGYEYSFTPENAVKVEIAYPVIGETMTTYNGFGTEGVTNADGVYTVLLKEGTNIVRLTDAAGNATYQVLRAKKAAYEIINLTREGKTPQAGDKVKVQYSGLYHPCNKLSGIYNMTGAIVYQGVANDNSIVGGSGQYNFGGTPAAQAFTISIPTDYDAEANPVYNIGTGLLRSSGFGSAYGAHRSISKNTGAGMNGNAVVGTAYFGQLPAIEIPLQVAKKYGVKFNITPEEADAEIVVKNSEGTIINPADDGYYYGIFGSYTYSISAEGYKRVMNKPLEYTDETEEHQTIDITLEALEEGDWDGFTMTEPTKNSEGYYVVKTGAELAWIANDVNSGNYEDNVSVEADINLGSFDWTPIGGSSASKAYSGDFKGNGHTISGLYINTTASYAGLFGYAKGNISGITVEGEVTTTANYAGGIAASFQGMGYSSDEEWRSITDCVNHAKVTGKQYVGGIVGQLTTGGEIDCCYNDAEITATTTTVSAGHVGGIAGYGNGFYIRIKNAYNLGNVMANAYVGGICGSYSSSASAENLFNLGKIKANSTNATYANYCGSIFGGNTSNYSSVKNLFAAVGYTAEYNTTLVEAEKFANGEVAYLLGEAFGQEIGVDEHPVLSGMKVYFDDDEYSNIKPFELAVATFENEDLDYLALDADSHIPELTEDFDEEIGYQSGDFWFDMKTYSDWATWWGYGVANHTSTDFEGLEDQFNSVTGCGVDGSENYSVAYVADYMGPVYITATTEEAVKVPGVYVTNAAYAFTSMLNGDSYAKKFAQGDWFKLTATGYDDDEEVTGTKDFYLADFRSKDKNDWYIINDWTYVDLSTLGKVRQIQFTLSSSDSGAWGMNTPAYFCLDNFGAKGTVVKPEGNYDVIYPTIELADKSEYTATESKQYKELTYTRTFGTTKWQPLYVPFSSEYSVWGENVKIAKVTTDDVDDNILTITYLEEGETVEANTPYFIKATEPCDIKVVVENATLVPAENASVKSGSITITGTYAPMTISPDTYYVLHSGSIVKTTNATGYNLAAMRWYIDSTASEVKVRIIGSDNEATEIADFNTAIDTESIYNTNGIRQQSLHKGINIVRMSDGTTRKVMVK